MGRRAYEHSRPMVWTEVAAAYARVFERVVGAAGPAVEPARYGYR
jgi:hypothetical protein